MALTASHGEISGSRGLAGESELLFPCPWASPSSPSEPSQTGIYDISSTSLHGSVKVAQALEKGVWVCRCYYHRTCPLGSNWSSFSHSPLLPHSAHLLHIHTQTGGYLESTSSWHQLSTTRGQPVFSDMSHFHRIIVEGTHKVICDKVSSRRHPTVCL